MGLRPYFLFEILSKLQINNGRNEINEKRNDKRHRVSERNKGAKEKQREETSK